MNFKKEYQAYNEVILPDKGLVEGMKEVAAQNRIQKGHRLFGKMRGVLAVAMACVCILVVIPVGAANVEKLYDIMYHISPELAEKFSIVQEYDEDQGIRMEVCSVYIHENEIKAYISLRDLESDRIDETTDLYDSYSINTPFDGYGSGGYEPVDFDEETGTATFLITLGHFDKEDGEKQEIQGKRIRFSLRRFLSKKAEYDSLEVPVSWEEVQTDAQTISMKLRGGDADNSVPATKFLVPGEPKSIVEGIYLTGMGYVDGKLHIQTMVPELLETDNHCELFLVDKEGNQRFYDYKINAFGDTKDTQNTDYQDCIFDISPKELVNYTLQGHFVTAGISVKGDWSITFPIEINTEND